MHKAAVTEYPVHELIRNRWSPRAFSDRPVEPAVLASLFEAARWAASSFNDQPWAYLVASRDDKENFAKMLGVLVEGNQKWAKRSEEHTSELQSRVDLVCRLLLEKKNNI